MLVSDNELRQLDGRGGVPFQRFLYDLVVAEGRLCGISPSDIEYDHRVNVADGGRDIIIRVDHSSARHFIPRVSSIWSAKAGADGTRVRTLQTELRDTGHEVLLEHMRRGGKYVWCVLQDLGHPGRDQMRGAASALEGELSLPANSIEFRWNESLTAVLEDHPNLISRHFPDIARALNRAHFYHEWERRTRAEFGFPWVNFEDRGMLKSRIHDYLLARSGPNVLHIAGLSGIGKTRTVFEACRDDEELRGVLYVPAFPSFTNELQRYLESPGRVAMVVIDEMPLNQLDAFIGQVQEFTDRLRFATIGPVPRGGSRRPGDPNLLLLSEPQTEDGVLQVVRGAGNGLPDPVLESIAAMSAHDLRLALLLVRATRQVPEYREVPIVDVGGIWQRIMSLFRVEIGDVDRFRDHYEALTSCIDVGKAGEFRAELEYLAQYHKFPAADLDRSIVSAARCGLGVETPSFFEPIPRALAVQLFQHCVWPALQPSLHDFLRAMPTERLRRQFIVLLYPGLDLSQQHLR